MNKTILGIFSLDQDAQNAIDDLQHAGYAAEDISIVMKDKAGTEESADITGTNVANSTVSGAVAGGVIGGIAGLLIGVGAIAAPGIGALLIGGPIAAALGATGAAATAVSGATTGVLAGGLIGALMGLGIPREEAAMYEERIRNGGILIAIPSQPGREDDVYAILEDNNADQVRAIDSSLSENSKKVYSEDVPSSQVSSYTPVYMGAKGGRSKSRSKRKVVRK